MFTITRQELLVHLLDRALFYREEAIKIRDNVTPLSAARSKKKVSDIFPGSELFSDEDNRRLAIDFATGQSKAFQFMADHLANQPEFSVTLHEAAQYELCSLSMMGQGMLAVAGRPRGA